MTDQQIIRVAVAVPLAHAFDYRCPAGCRPPLGGRVRIPFGRGERVGLVVGHPASSELELEEMKEILEPLDEQPLLEAELLELIDFAAGYYYHPIGAVVAQATLGLLGRAQLRPAGVDPGWMLTARGKSALDEPTRRHGPRQNEALRAFATEPLRTRETLDAAGISSAAVRRLVTKGWLAPAWVPKPRWVADEALEPWPELTGAQHDAVRAILSAADGYRAFLLDGVTGSGKTEVYLRLIRDALERDRQALLLVPEIGLTPLLVRRLKARFGNRLAVLHSALSDATRLEAWQRAHACDAEVLVGTRSAIFASLPRLGLIIVDEEHDISYKQQSGFRYSARDLSLVRARNLGIRVVLGSATPSLESYHNANIGRYQRIALPERVGRAGKPALHIVDLNRHARRESMSAPLMQRIDTHLARGHQVILFLNRRGFAPALFCPTCGEAERCDRCDATLTVHTKAGRLRCHHCGRERQLLWTCPGCGSERLAVGAGTQRVVNELESLQPDAVIGRLDRDTTSRKGALDGLLDDVGSGRIQVLIGTQMLTKGHDFDNVTLVGILNADQGLFGTDFRSEERLAQTIIQVAGRAGRGEKAGEVLVQTHHPGHPLLQALTRAGYAAFADTALREREAADWPPFSHLAVMRAEARQPSGAIDFLLRVRHHAGRDLDGVSILGPAPAAMERMNGRHRAQLLIKCHTRGPLHALLNRLVAGIREDPAARRVRWSIDVDPAEL